MIFSDRKDAAHRLVKELEQFRGQNPLVLAIPRGAVQMARIIAEELEGEVDVVLVRKLRAPENPEFAVGSVDESGWTYLSDYAGRLGGSSDISKPRKKLSLRSCARGAPAIPRYDRRTTLRGALSSSWTMDWPPARQ